MLRLKKRDFFLLFEKWDLDFSFLIWDFFVCLFGVWEFRLVACVMLWWWWWLNVMLIRERCILFWCFYLFIYLIEMCFLLFKCVCAQFCIRVFGWMENMCIFFLWVFFVFFFHRLGAVVGNFKMWDVLLF